MMHVAITTVSNGMDLPSWTTQMQTAVVNTSSSECAHVRYPVVVVDSGG